MVHRIRDGDREILRGEAADYRAAIEELPYGRDGKLSEGDEVVSYLVEDDGETAVFERRVRTYEEYRGRSPTDDIYYVLGSSSISCKQCYRCPVTNVRFYVSDAHPRDLPKTCPECGANSELDGVDSCIDAHALEGAQDDSHDAQSHGSDAQDARDAQGGEQPQTTLTGFVGGGE